MIKVILGQGNDAQEIECTDFELLLRFPRSQFSAQRLQQLSDEGIRLQMDDEVVPGESQILPEGVWELHSFSADTPVAICWGTAATDEALNAASKQLEATLNKLLGGEDE